MKLLAYSRTSVAAPCTIEVWEWIGFIVDVITYACMDLSQSMLVKGAQQRNYILFRTVTFRRGDAI